MPLIIRVYIKQISLLYDILFATLEMDLAHCHLEIQSSNLTPPSNIRKRRRRQPEEETEKTFACHCGKVYLSYPGLYIHKKSKHGQKPIRPKNQMRSAILQDNPLLRRDERASEPILFDRQDREVIDGPLNLECLQKYLQRFVSEGELRQAKDDQIYQIAREMTHYWQFNCKEHEPRACGLYTTPVALVLGHFLRALQKAVNPKYHAFIYRTVIDFESAVCEFYQNMNYTKTHSAHPLPLLMNQLAILMMNRAQENITLGDRQKRRCIICLILFFLSRWIKMEGFTAINLRLNLA